MFKLIAPLALLLTDVAMGACVNQLTGLGNWYIEATHPDSGTMYVQLNNGILLFDLILDPFPDQVGVGLERFTSSCEGNATLYNTVLVNGTIPNPFKTKEPSWKSKAINAFSKDITVTKNGNSYTVAIDGDSKTIEKNDAGDIISFAGMPIIKYSPDVSLWDARPSSNILSPTNADIEPPVPIGKSNENDAAYYDTVVLAASRQLRGREALSDAPAYTECARNMSMDTYKLDTQKKNTYMISGDCAGYSTIAFQGTDFTYITDVIDDLKGVVDNFKSAYEHVDYTTGLSYGPYHSGGVKGQRYDVCTGHSLGGAIAKYAAILGLCGQVVTFGCPLTVDFPASVPIAQYIHIKESGGCCSRHWWGGCAEEGAFYQDPVTMVGYGVFSGTDVDIKYVGDKPGNCAESLLSTVLNTGAELHSNPYPLTQ